MSTCAFASSERANQTNTSGTRSKPRRQEEWLGAFVTKTFFIVRSIRGFIGCPFSCCVSLEWVSFHSGTKGTPVECSVESCARDCGVCLKKQCGIFGHMESKLFIH